MPRKSFSRQPGTELRILDQLCQKPRLINAIYFQEPNSIFRESHVRTGRSCYLFKALQISMTTRTDRAIVLAFGLSNTLQSMLGNVRGSARHCM